MATLRWVVQLHRDVPKAARFYSDGLGLSLNVCTLKWAELQSGSFKLALLQAPGDFAPQKGYSSFLSFNVTDINSTVTRLISMGAELDGTIKHEVHGKCRLQLYGVQMAICWAFTSPYDLCWKLG